MDRRECAGNQSPLERVDFALGRLGSRERLAGRGAAVRVDRVAKSYGAVRAVQQVSLAVAAGEFVSLLGPSGSGKTTLLMMIAGFETPDAGTLHIGDRDVTQAEPNERNLGMVFQRYALFPHLTVADNIAFPLKMRKLARADIAHKVEAALARVRLAGYGERKPDQLSGGQQQRVALARATVFDPPVILMDEPLGALDKKLREQMQIEIKQLQRELGATVVYVTHDQQEALTMSDRVAVMNHGRIEQLSAPQVLYDRPLSMFVADFVGDTNLLRGTVRTVEGDVATLELATGEAVQGRVASTTPPKPTGDTSEVDSAVIMRELRTGDVASLCIRPERLGPAIEGQSRIFARFADAIYVGPDLTLVGSIGDGQPLRLRIGTRDQGWQPGVDGGLVVGWRTEDAIVFPGEPERA